MQSNIENQIVIARPRRGRGNLIIKFVPLRN